MEKKEKLKLINKFYIKKMIISSSASSYIRNFIFFSSFHPVNPIIFNKTIFIYNGSVFRQLLVLKFFNMMRIGLFVYTKKPFKFLLKKNKR